MDSQIGIRNKKKCILRYPEVKDEPFSTIKNMEFKKSKRWRKAGKRERKKTKILRISY